LRVLEKRVLRRIFGLNREEVAGGWGNCIMKSFIKMTVFWDVALCSLIEIDQWFRGAMSQKTIIFILVAMRT
jgi:hypothetical protein